MVVAEYSQKAISRPPVDRVIPDIEQDAKKISIVIATVIMDHDHLGIAPKGPLLTGKSRP
jgi:hypothetical protein